jgi:GT2 family glycosyltransferase
LPCPAKLVSYHGAFNFGHMHNTVIREHVRGDLLLLLNNDVFLDERSDLAEWAAWAAQPWVGTVGILLRYAHGQVQHSGIRARFGGEARLVRLGHSSAEQSFVYESREVFANTFAACLLKRSVFEAIGGLRQVDMANGFGDVAFNFDCLRRGWHNLYLGHLQGMHLESASRGAGASYEYWEERELEREYPEILERMLRSDFGYDTVPSHDHSIARAIGQALRIKFRQSTPWLDPLKPAVKKLLWNLQQRRHNRSEI